MHANFILFALSNHGSTKYFEQDPFFPERLFSSGYGETLKFIQNIIVDYSSRGITDNTDIVVVLSGLENRISRALGCKTIYGIFGLYLHRTLLWKRSGEEMERIAYKNHCKVLSLSWMAYNGGVEFLEEPSYPNLDVTKNLKLDKNTLIAQLWRFDKGCEMEWKTGCYTIIHHITEREVGVVQYNVKQRKELFAQGRMEKLSANCFVLATHDSQYYMIVVIQRESFYQRIRFGRIEKSYVTPLKGDICIV